MQTCFLVVLQQNYQDLLRSLRNYLKYKTVEVLHQSQKSSASWLLPFSIILANFWFNSRSQFHTYPSVSKDLGTRATNAWRKRSWKERFTHRPPPCRIAATQRGKERVIRYSRHSVRDVKRRQSAKPTITSKQILSVTWKVKVFAAFCAHYGSLLEKKLCHSRAHNIFHVRVVRQISWHRYYETEKNYCIIVFVYPMTSLFFFFTSYICFHHAEINFISSSQRNKKNSLNWETRATAWTDWINFQI